MLVLRRHAEYAVTLMRNLQVTQYRQEVVQILPDVFYSGLNLNHEQHFEQVWKIIQDKFALNDLPSSTFRYLMKLDLAAGVDVQIALG